MATAAPAIDQLRAFSVAEVAERVGISKRSVERLVADGTLRTIFPRRKGVLVRIPAASLAEFLEGVTDGPGGAK